MILKFNSATKLFPTSLTAAHHHHLPLKYASMAFMGRLPPSASAHPSHHGHHGMGIVGVNMGAYPPSHAHAHSRPSGATAHLGMGLGLGGAHTHPGMSANVALDQLNAMGLTGE